MASTVEQLFSNPNCASEIQVLLLQKVTTILFNRVVPADLYSIPHFVFDISYNNQYLIYTYIIINQKTNTLIHDDDRTQNKYGLIIEALAMSVISTEEKHGVYVSIHLNVLSPHPVTNYLSMA